MNSMGPNRQIILYIAAVLLAAWLWMLSIKLGFRPSEWVWITVLMWIPGLASILFRFVFREGLCRCRLARRQNSILSETEPGGSPTKQNEDR